jgi:hypothetical protein
METQKHGFNLEKEILSRIFNLTYEEIANIKYTSKMDLPAIYNRLDHCDVSIKTTGTPNTVCMADSLRMFDAVNSNTPFHLLVIYYVQQGNTKIIKGIVELDLTNSRELLFGSITRSQLEELDKTIKLVPQKQKPTKEERATMYSMQYALQVLSGSMYLNIKCNSTQSRLQCSFNQFQTFIEQHPEKIISKSNTNEFRGGSISSQIISPRRVFKKPVVESNLIPH